MEEANRQGCSSSLAVSKVAEMAAFVFCCAGSTAQDVEEGGADGGGPVGAKGGLSGAKRNPRVSSCVQGYLL